MTYSRLSIIDRCIITTTLLLTMGIAIGFVATTRHSVPEVEYETRGAVVTTVTTQVTVTEEAIESTTELDDEEQYISLGEYRLTAYCSCDKCCDHWATNRPTDEDGNPIIYTANQSIAKQGVTVAADTNVLPFGTVLLINGHEYIVQDRGGAIKQNRIDIYFESHEEALQFGVQYKEIFVKEGAV